MNRPGQSSPSHCIIIPSYNSGTLLTPTLRSVLPIGLPTFLVIDGSTDSSERTATSLANDFPNLHVFPLQQNQGKGGAVLIALRLALSRGFSHAVLFDSDGQHDQRDIPSMIRLSRQFPEAMILGSPIFGPDAPAIRVYGRRIANWCTNIESLWGGLGDSLFGFRIYPVDASIRILDGITSGRRFDFETQLAIRLYWNGTPAIQFPTRVVYPEKTSGGVSHFKYLRDNLLLIKTHTALVFKALGMFSRLLNLRKHNTVYRTESAKHARRL
ncbi:MAG: glycosyltransferase family 2 protein [Verrucomicrobiota bacterium]